jgi:LPS-assembly protein
MKLSRIILLATFVLQIAHAAPVNSGSYVLNADHIEYEKDSNTIVAKGKVEIFKDNYTLKADKIIYDKNKKTAFAYNNVLLIGPNGDKTYAQFIELNHALKEGLVENLTAYLTDNNTFTAEKAEYKSTQTSIFKNARYTPCPFCKTKNPQWQIKARKATYIPKETITFNHSIFEVYGVPVFYTPYFQTFAPDAPPKSGFLLPKKYQYNKVYGHSITVPIYYRIADNMDLLYNPMITSTQGPLHQAKYRHLTPNGYYELEGNYLQPRNNNSISVKHLYHVKGQGKNTLNEHFFVKAKLDKVSDKSYLPNYWNINENYLTSDANLTYHNHRDYGTLNSFYFQDLRTDPNNLNNPTILPLADYHKELFYNDNKFSINTNAVHLLRKAAQLNTKRFSSELAWDKEITARNNRFSFIQRFRASVFNFSNQNIFKNQHTTQQKRELTVIAPESEIKWSYPLVSLKDSYSLYVSPIINLIAAPNSSKNSKIVNEDSQTLELSDTNLFSNDRYAGYDQIEYGNRANYGINADLFTGDYHYNFVVGQVARQKKSKDYPVNSGLYNKNFSDYVGHLGIHPVSWLSVFYRFRLDEKDLSSRKQEIDNQLFFNLDNNIINSITLGSRISKIDYVPSNSAESLFNKVVSFYTNVKIFKEWFVEGSTTQNFTKNSNFLVQANIALGYNGECSSFKLTAIKNLTYDPTRNIKPNKGFSFDWDINLKNIN